MHRDLRGGVQGVPLSCAAWRQNEPDAFGFRRNLAEDKKLSELWLHGHERMKRTKVSLIKVPPSCPSCPMFFVAEGAGGRMQAATRAACKTNPMSRQLGLSLGRHGGWIG